MTLPPQSHDEDAAEDGGRTQDKAQGDGLAHEDHRPQGRDHGHTQLSGGSGRDTVTGHQRIYVFFLALYWKEDYFRFMDCGYGCYL